MILLRASLILLTVTCASAFATVDSQAVPVSTPSALITVAEHTAAQAQSARLRTQVTVTDDSIYLGDIFVLPKHKKAQRSVKVTESPTVGKKLVLGPDRLTALSVAFGLGWTPTPTADRVIVTRQGTIIGHEKLLDLLQSAFKKRGISSDFDIELSQIPEPIKMASEREHDISLTNIAFNRHTKTFTARVHIPQGLTSDPQTLVLSGRMYEMVTVPVLTRSLARKDVIQPRDVSWKRLSATAHANGTVITEIDDAIGMELKRPLRAGRAIRSRDLKKPVLVGRGDLVLLEMRTRAMSLTSRGKALEDGSLGESIRIENMQSKRTITGTVVGHRTVKVSDFPHTTLLKTGR